LSQFFTERWTHNSSSYMWRSVKVLLTILSSRRRHHFIHLHLWKKIFLSSFRPLMTKNNVFIKNVFLFNNIINELF
jgi:hypothetical protein